LVGDIPDDYVRQSMAKGGPCSPSVSRDINTNIAGDISDRWIRRIKKDCIYRNVGQVAGRIGPASASI